jgi:hypothetical protein
MALNFRVASTQSALFDIRHKSPRKAPSQVKANRHQTNALFRPISDDSAEQGIHFRRSIFKSIRLNFSMFVDVNLLMLASVIIALTELLIKRQETSQKKSAVDCDLDAGKPVDNYFPKESVAPIRRTVSFSASCVVA